MSNFNKKEFGNNIRKFRKAKGLSQENLAMLLNKTPATIARYETGEIIPNAEQIYLICNELGIYESIQKFFENNLNVSETSRKLFVHRNTLFILHCILSKIKKIWKR